MGSPSTLAYEFQRARQYYRSGQLQAAEQIYRQLLAAKLNPDQALAVCNNLGMSLRDQGRATEALECFERAVQLGPRNAEAHNNLGTVLHARGDLTRAVTCFQAAIDIEPRAPGFHNNLANVLKSQGLIAPAIAALRRALELEPAFAAAHSNLLYLLHFCPEVDTYALLAEHRLWNQRHARPFAHFVAPHDRDRSPDRRLRIGYVSPDLWLHSVGRFLLPLLQAHDRECVEVVCYASVRNPDALTDQCRACADIWRPVYGLTDEQLDRVIREDQIDILVDLSMHSADNRLLVFARKPAPIQVTYLAYCGTTGLDTMDYRFSDPYFDPPEQADDCYSETTIRLPRTYWCYLPPIEAPAANRRPALSANLVTFGCLNNFCKVTEATLATWRRLLQALPQSRLLLHADFGSHRDRIRDSLAAQQIAPERLEFVSWLPAADYFRAYDRIDVALDPFPYGGGTTTCDALWMGVPVVSLAGQTAVGRAGASVLSNLGLERLVARDVDDYLRIAADLASDAPRLSALRETMRDTMRASPLMDAARFARAVEAAYREMWMRYGRESPR